MWTKVLNKGVSTLNRARQKRRASSISRKRTLSQNGYGDNYDSRFEGRTREASWVRLDTAKMAP